MKDLPIGLQTFENLIQGNFLYVDKTKEIYNLIRPSRGVYFLSRPRRFGKSLLVTTLAAIFEGKRDLFKGLWLAEQTDYAFKQYPVIQVDFSLEQVETVDQLKNYILSVVNKFAEKYQVTLESSTYNGRFAELIRKLGQTQQIVILIDEYDKPLLDNINKPSRDEIKETLKGFYIVIKASDAYLRFVLLTGVTKFAKISVFSGLNNLLDISMDERYAELLGITQAELESYFEPRLISLEQSSNLERELLLNKIRFWYNGYRFSARETHVYNPFSTLLLLELQQFKFHWFETGTPTFLIDLIKQKPLGWENIERNNPVTEQSFSIYEIENLQPLPLLFQTGYLTIKQIIGSDEERAYYLGYPNFEVKKGFLQAMLTSFTYLEGTNYLIQLVAQFQQGHLDGVLETLKLFFAEIPYTIQIKQEKYYQTIFYAIFQLLGLRISAEVTTNRGRIDAVVEMAEAIYLFEFKLFGTKEEALAQIKRQNYYQKYLLRGKKLIFIGVEFDQTERNIGSWLIEEHTS